MPLHVTGPLLGVAYLYGNGGVGFDKVVPGDHLAWTLFLAGVTQPLLRKVLATRGLVALRIICDLAPVLDCGVELSLLYAQFALEIVTDVQRAHLPGRSQGADHVGARGTQVAAA